MQLFFVTGVSLFIKQTVMDMITIHAEVIFFKNLYSANLCL